MKGTMDASIPGAYRLLASDPKEDAEHNTIVDLIRNDLSLVAKNVRVKRFKYIEKLRTHQGELLQMSSEINGKLPAEYKIIWVIYYFPSCLRDLFAVHQKKNRGDHSEN